MASAEAEISQALDKQQGLTPTAKKSLTGTLLTSIKTLKRPSSLTVKGLRADLAQYRPLQLSLVTTLGGALAEPIRRSVIGRITTKCINQGVGLVLLGGAVQFLTSNRWISVPMLGPLGAAHCSYGGALIAISMYGTDDNPDPVKIAIEGTTYKALHPSKKSDDAGTNP